MRLRTVSIVLAVSALLWGCADDTSAPVTTAERKLTEVPHAAPLGRRLPAQATAYVRIPSLADFLFLPQRNGMNEVKVTAVNEETTEALLQGLQDNVFGVFGEPQVDLASVLLADARAPIELAFITAAAAISVPEILLRTELSGQTRASLNEKLAAASANAPWSVANPLDDDGYGLINAVLPVFLHFDEASGELHAYAGLAAARSVIENYVTGQYEQSSAVADFEGPRDDVGRGLAVWVDVTKLWPAVEVTQPPEMLEQLRLAGVDQIDFLWLGTVARDGRAEALLHLEMPAVGARLAFHPVDSPCDLGVAGTPSWALRAALPDSEHIGRVLSLLRSIAPEMAAELPAMHELMTAELGMDPLELLDLLGPELLVVSDESGRYLAARERDSEGMRALEDELGKREWISFSEQSMAGEPVTQVDMTSGFVEDADMGELPPPVAAILGRLGGPSFFARDDGYLINASVPQVLKVRADSNSGTLDDWLDGHDVNWDNAILAFMSELRASPRDIYYAYLQVLGTLATLADVPVDLTDFPTAPAVGMPRTGRLGFRIDATENAVSAHLSYETTAAEVFLNNAFLTAYVAGIAAAVAIPAYEEMSGGAMGDEPLACPYTNDGECDEPLICPPGTDTADCGEGSGGPDSCPFANDGECDEPNPCPTGTDTSDCAGVEQGPDSCIYANDGECDEPEYCAAGTDTTDCGI
ncbi:MAG: hypothetical protein AAGE01_14975 [Pseudomonadota bacterium]